MEIKLLQIFSGGITSPLVLGGLTVVVFYLVTKVILKLPIFSSVGQKGTKEIIHKVINYIFILALIAVVAGIGTSILKIAIPEKEKQPVSENKPKPEDNNNSEHEQTETVKKEQNPKRSKSDKSKKVSRPHKNISTAGDSTTGDKSPIIKNVDGNVQIDIK